MSRRIRVLVAALAMIVAVMLAPVSGQTVSGQEKDPDKTPTGLPPIKVQAKEIKPATPVGPPTFTPAPPFDPTDVPPTTPGSDGNPAGPAPFRTGGIFASQPTTGYGAPSETTGTIVNVPLVDYPGSIGIVTPQTIRDQQALRIEDLARDVSSVQKLGDFRRPDALLIRGFEVTSRDYRWNGFLDPSYAPRDVQNIQRVEIMKGPASVLYGAGQPSGLVNVITKKAQGTFGGSVAYQFDNFGLSRPTVDVTGPATDALNYRMNFAYQDTESFRDFGYDDRLFLAPTFTYLLGENTLLEYQGSVTRDRANLDSGLAVINGDPRALGIETYLNRPGDYRRFNDYKNGLWLTHKINDCWTARAGGYVGWYDLPSYGNVPLFGGKAIGPIAPLYRQVQTGIDTNESYASFIGQLFGDFDGMAFHHKLLVGTEMGWFQSDNSSFQFSDPISTNPLGAPTSFIDAFHPRLQTTTSSIPGFFNSEYHQYRYGLYAQDIVDVTERVKLLAGARYDIVDFTYNRIYNNPFAGFNVGFPQTDTQTTYFRVTPRVGLTYFIVPEVFSAYAAYAQSFDPPPGAAYKTAAPLLPETGDSYEVGLHGSFLEKKLQVDMAGFRIEKSNVTTQDSFFNASQVGRIRSQGFEASATGSLTERWSVITNYSYIDSRILEDDSRKREGNRFRNVPYNTLNLWTRHNLYDCELQTFGLAFGMVAMSNRAGDLDNSFNLPSFVRWDAGVYYRYNHLNANVYLENLFDRRYESSSIDTHSVFPGAPFTARAQVGWTF